MSSAANAGRKILTQRSQWMRSGRSGNFAREAHGDSLAGKDRLQANARNIPRVHRASSAVTALKSFEPVSRAFMGKVIFRPT
jgi:hypothetical protein